MRGGPHLVRDSPGPDPRAQPGGLANRRGGRVSQDQGPRLQDHHCPQKYRWGELTASLI